MWVPIHKHSGSVTLLWLCHLENKQMLSVSVRRLKRCLSQAATQKCSFSLRKSFFKNLMLNTSFPMGKKACLLPPSTLGERVWGVHQGGGYSMCQAPCSRRQKASTSCPYRKTHTEPVQTGHIRSSLCLHTHVCVSLGSECMFSLKRPHRRASIL